MIRIDTAITIDAPASEVWAVLADAASYPEWNPHFAEIEGALEPDADLTLHVERIGVDPTTIPATVTAFEPERRLEWTATVVSRFVFRGRHTFDLEPLGDDRTLFVNRERIAGIAARFAMTDEPERDYEAMNAALKARVEDTS